MRYWEADQPEWGPQEHAFARAWRSKPLWVASRTLDLWSYDSGGDDGTTYKAADQDNTPKKATTENRDRHFAPKGTALAVGTVTITRNQ